MILFKKASDLRKWFESQDAATVKTGFVPTMGALHEGHIALVAESISENPVTVCSIFINPTQFNDADDFAKYPVTLEKDIDALEAAGCDILFLPSVEEIYPGGISAAGEKKYDLGPLEHTLEGAFRPGHYQGVAMVVHRLLDIVRPDRLYLGQKDYQQCLVIARLRELIGIKPLLRIVPTFREKNGLAMSSRNQRLDPAARENAGAIYASLKEIERGLRKGGESNPLCEAAQQRLAASGLRTEYVVVTDANRLEPVSHWDGKQDIVILVAAWADGVRLIDNIVIKGG
jgi:pantoate--beta-alanine ligase